MTQTLVVGLIVVLAVLYVLWRYMPQKWRHPLGKINPKLAQVSGCGGGCSSCDSTPAAQGKAGGSSCRSAGDAPDSRPLVFHPHAGEHGKR